MRDHGVPMEDPVIGENGRVEIQAGAPGEGDSRDDDDFQAAQEECNQEVGGIGPGAAPSSVPEDGDE
jgi:hypothetical protein